MNSDFSKLFLNIYLLSFNITSLRESLQIKIIIIILGRYLVGRPNMGVHRQISDK